MTYFLSPFVSIRDQEKEYFIMPEYSAKVLGTDVVVLINECYLGANKIYVIDYYSDSTNFQTNLYSIIMKCSNEIFNSPEEAIKYLIETKHFKQLTQEQFDKLEILK